MHRKESILRKYTQIFRSGVDTDVENVYDAMDDFAKVMIRTFGDWKLSNDMQYERGQNKEWGKWSFDEKVDKFFDFLNDKTKIK